MATLTSFVRFLLSEVNVTKREEDQLPRKEFGIAYRNFCSENHLPQATVIEFVGHLTHLGITVKPVEDGTGFYYVFCGVAWKNKDSLHIITNGTPKSEAKSIAASLRNSPLVYNGRESFVLFSQSSLVYCNRREKYVKQEKLEILYKEFCSRHQLSVGSVTDITKHLISIGIKCLQVKHEGKVFCRALGGLEFVKGSSDNGKVLHLNKRSSDSSVANLNMNVNFPSLREEHENGMGSGGNHLDGTFKPNRWVIGVQLEDNLKFLKKQSKHYSEGDKQKDTEENGVVCISQSTSNNGLNAGEGSRMNIRRSSLNRECENKTANGIRMTIERTKDTEVWDVRSQLMDGIKHLKNNGKRCSEVGSQLNCVCSPLQENDKGKTCVVKSTKSPEQIVEGVQLEDKVECLKNQTKQDTEVDMETPKGGQDTGCITDGSINKCLNKSVSQLDVRSSPLREEHENVRSSPIREEHDNVRSSPLREEHENITSSPLREEHENVRSSPLREDHENVRSSPLREDHENVRSSPLQEEHKNARSSPLREEHENVRSSPLREEHENARSSPLREENENVRSSPLLEEHKNARSSPLEEEHENVRSSPLRGEHENVNATKNAVMPERWVARVQLEDILKCSKNQGETYSEVDKWIKKECQDVDDSINGDSTSSQCSNPGKINEDLLAMMDYLERNGRPKQCVSGVQLRDIRRYPQYQSKLHFYKDDRGDWILMPPSSSYIGFHSFKRFVRANINFTSKMHNLILCSDFYKAYRGFCSKRSIPCASAEDVGHHLNIMGIRTKVKILKPASPNLAYSGLTWRHKAFADKFGSVKFKVMLHNFKI